MTPSLRERRRALLRDEILAATHQLMAERGYAATDLQVVADAIGVGKGTIYRYFPSKRDLFMAAVDRGMRLLKEQIHEVKASFEDPLDGTFHVIRSYLAFYDAHPEYIELTIQERAVFKDRKRPTYFEYRDLTSGERIKHMQAMMDQGRMRKMPPERIIEVVNNLLYGTIFTNYFAGNPKSLEEQARDHPQRRRGAGPQGVVTPHRARASRRSRPTRALRRGRAHVAHDR